MDLCGGVSDQVDLEVCFAMFHDCRFSIFVQKIRTCLDLHHSVLEQCSSVTKSRQLSQVYFSYYRMQNIVEWKNSKQCRELQFSEPKMGAPEEFNTENEPIMYTLDQNIMLIKFI